MDFLRKQYHNNWDLRDRNVILYVLVLVHSSAEFRLYRFNHNSSAEPYHYLNTLLINSESIFIYFPRIHMWFLCFSSISSQSFACYGLFFHFCSFALVHFFTCCCLHSISLYVYLPSSCLCGCFVFACLDVYCWVQARNQYSILIVLSGELAHSSHTPHIMPQYTSIHSVVERAFVCCFIPILLSADIFRFGAIFSSINVVIIFFCIFAYILRFNNCFAKSFSVMEKRIACVLCEHLHIPWEGGAQLIGREENQ